MREKVGKEFPIGLKINSSDFSNNGFTEEESIIVIKKMLKYTYINYIRKNIIILYSLKI